MLKENIIIIQETYTIYVLYICVFIFVYNVNFSIFHKLYYKIIYAEV